MSPLGTKRTDLHVLPLLPRSRVKRILHGPRRPGPIYGYMAYRAAAVTMELAADPER
jgi:hypothetical protein